MLRFAVIIAVSAVLSIALYETRQNDLVSLSERLDRRKPRDFLPYERYSRY